MAEMMTKPAAAAMGGRGSKKQRKADRKKLVEDIASAADVDDGARPDELASPVQWPLAPSVFFDVYQCDRLPENGWDDILNAHRGVPTGQRIVGSLYRTSDGSYWRIEGFCVRDDTSVLEYGRPGEKRWRLVHIHTGRVAWDTGLVKNMVHTNFVAFPKGSDEFLDDARVFFTNKRGERVPHPGRQTAVGPGGLKWRGAWYNDMAGEMIQHISTNATMDELVVNDSVKAQVEEAIKSYFMSKELAEVGLQPSRKVLFTGPPGTGKTMSANVIADAVGLPFFIIKTEGILDKFFGEAEKRMAALFDEIEKHPGVFLFDEADSLVSARGAGGGVMSNLVNILLQALEKNKSEGLIIFATNFKSKLDAALFRRFDTTVEYELPDATSRRLLLERGLSKAEVPEDMDWLRLVDKSAHLGHADILQACKGALRKAVLAGHKKVDTEAMFISLGQRVQTEDPEKRNADITRRIFGMSDVSLSPMQPQTVKKGGRVTGHDHGQGADKMRWCETCGFTPYCGHRLGLAGPPKSETETGEAQ